jgi:hypothetical protein
MQVQNAATMMLAESLADSDMAAVVSLSATNSGLTHDRRKLQEAVMKIKGHQLFRHDDHACPSVDYYQLTPGAMAEKSHILDLAAQANITIRALDARGLYTTEIGASERGGSSAQDLMTGQHAQDHSETMTLEGDVMAELADGRGGTFFHNSNDLEGGLKSLARGPEYLYLLEFSPEKFKPDGSYHRLKVKVHRDGLKVQARRGYFTPAPSKNKK